MGDMIFLAAAYAVFWLVSFGFIYSMVSRQRSLAREIAALEELARPQAENSVGHVTEPNPGA